ncbi:hypothetical protein C7M84_001785 [Penaeus vannamei]|uniref:Uncharacterized protein n=1 Tax=Penaeus vannamei TaxID=6689 RepID=A0A3R7SX53_PENVA|nr:hypothetical protein C7M84_001785 [Penaeus vannamei]
MARYFSFISSSLSGDPSLPVSVYFSLSLAFLLLSFLFSPPPLLSVHPSTPSYPSLHPSYPSSTPSYPSLHPLLSIPPPPPIHPPPPLIHPSTSSYPSLHPLLSIPPPPIQETTSRAAGSFWKKCRSIPPSPRSSSELERLEVLLGKLRTLYSWSPLVSSLSVKALGSDETLTAMDTSEQVFALLVRLAQLRQSNTVVGGAALVGGPSEVENGQGDPVVQVKELLEYWLKAIRSDQKNSQAVPVPKTPDTHEGDTEEEEAQTLAALQAQPSRLLSLHLSLSLSVSPYPLLFLFPCYSPSPSVSLSINQYSEQEKLSLEMTRRQRRWCRRDFQTRFGRKACQCLIYSGAYPTSGD